MKNKENHSLTREERRRRQKLRADLLGLGVVAALLGAGYLLGWMARR